MFFSTQYPHRFVTPQQGVPALLNRLIAIPTTADEGDDEVVGETAQALKADADAMLDKLIAEETGLPVIVAEDPLTCVAIGTGRAMEDPIFRGVLQTA